METGGSLAHKLVPKSRNSSLQRRPGKHYNYISANKTKLSFAKLATFCDPSNTICLEASTQVTLKGSIGILLLGLWRLIKSLITGGRALKHSCIRNHMHIYNLRFF